MRIFPNLSKLIRRPQSVWRCLKSGLSPIYIDLSNLFISDARVYVSV